jgi:hypothetical protein
LAAEDANNSAGFSSTNLPAQRNFTTARTQSITSDTWNKNTWYAYDVTGSVQEVVNRAGWASGNKLSIIIHGLGESNQQKDVMSYNGNAANAPRLVVTYGTNTVATPQPATATATATLYLPTVTRTPALTGTPPTGGPKNCNYTIGTSVTSADGAGNFASVKPGDTVCIAAGNRGGLKLSNFKGSASAPITFINSGGTVVINNTSNSGGIGIQLYNSQYIHLTGTGDPGATYGIQVYNSANSAVDTNHGGTEYVEFDHIYAQNVGAGFRTAKNNDLLDTGIVWSGHQYYIHDNYIKTTTSEAMYIGTSDTHGTFPIYDVQVWNNRIEDAGYDGIQIRQAHTRVLVHHNTINGTGRDPCKNGSIDNTAGFNIAKGTDTGDWYDNIVIGARTAFYIKDSANVRVYNNVVLDSGHATSGLSGPDCPAGVTGTPPEGAVQILNANNVQFMFNTIANRTVNAAYGIQINGATGTVHDNLVGGIFNSLITGSGMTLTNNLASSSLAYFGFVNPNANDYHLTAGSPAVNQSSTSAFPPVDFDGVARPQGMRSDAGAYEYH